MGIEPQRTHEYSLLCPTVDQARGQPLVVPVEIELARLV